MNLLSGVRSRNHSLRLLATFTSVLALSAVVIAIPLAAPVGAAPAALRLGSVPLVPKGAVPLGSLATSTVLTIDVALKPRDPAALAAYATAVSTPGSTLYRHYLPAGAFPQKFGPTSATIGSVTKWLRVQGLRPSAISADHLIFPVTATVGQLEQAFSINLVRYNLGHRIAFSNTAAPLITGAVAGAVQGIIGLSNIYLAQHQSILSASTKRLAKPHTSPRVYNAGPTPCTDAVDDGEDYDAYTANRLATAYSFTSLYNESDLGAGQRVALFELEPNETSDISAYESCYGISTSVTYIEEDGGAGSGYGSGEAALDIEDVAGLAPGVKIDVYQAPNSETGLIDNYTAIVDADTAKVVSTSWGLCEPLEVSEVISEENTLFEQAATQGQSVFAAAGDNGSEDCYESDGSTTLSVDDPASQPFVTGVGGTSLSAIGPPPTQTVWNDESSSSEGAGGGGISSLWTMPSYQSGAPGTLNVINSNSSGTPCAAASGSYCREVPDVTADADPYDGYVVYFGGSWTAIGGTSAAAPLWAAFMALTNAGCTAPIGFANPTLYSVAGSSSYSSTFSDITSGNNDYTGSNDGLYPAGTAYDMASGLGSPNGSALPAALCSVGVPPPIAGGLTPLTPDRILDTRVDNGASGPVPPTQVISVQVVGRGGVPASGVGAVVLNVTVTDPQFGGYLTVYPDGVTRPATSNLNFSKGETIPNLVVAPLGSNGKVDFYNGSGGTVQIIGDVSGWFASGTAGTGGLTPLTPDRIMDTRVDNGASGPVPAEGEVSLQVEGRGGVPATGVGAVVLNVTATQPTGGGYLTVYPDGGARPVTSNLNFSKGQTIPNLVVAPVGSDGKVDFYNGSGGTVQILGDVSGWFASGTAGAGGLTPLTPDRIMDTRVDNGVSGPVPAEKEVSLQVVGRGGVPAYGVGAVILNVTVTSPQYGGYITVYPDGFTRPVTSNLNFSKGQTIPNLVVAPVGSDGKIDFYNGSGGTVQIIGDVSGWWSNA
jgi:hypothetical protein